jgi:hypothetical protein
MRQIEHLEPLEMWCKCVDHVVGAPQMQEAQPAHLRQRGDDVGDDLRPCRIRAVDHQLFEVGTIAPEQPRHGLSGGPQRRREREFDELWHRAADAEPAEREPAQGRDVRKLLEQRGLSPPPRPRPIAYEQALEQRRCGADHLCDDCRHLGKLADRNVTHEPRARLIEQHCESFRRRLERLLQPNLVDEPDVPADPAAAQDRRARAEDLALMIVEIADAVGAQLDVGRICFDRRRQCRPLAERLADRLQPIAVDHARRRIDRVRDNRRLERGIARCHPLRRHASS